MEINLKSITKQLVMHEHLNRRGDLFGGQMMSWMDIAAAIHAFDVTNMDCVTVAVDRIEFILPVSLGDLVTFEVTEKERGSTSITLNVIAYKSNLKQKMVEVARSNFKFVAIGEDGRPSSKWNDGDKH